MANESEEQAFDRKSKIRNRRKYSTHHSKLAISFLDLGLGGIGSDLEDLVQSVLFRLLRHLVLAELWGVLRGEGVENNG